MLAYKTILKIKNDTLFLKIPSNFKGKSVEIIVLETQEISDNNLMEGSSETNSFYDSLFNKIDDNISISLNQEPNDLQKIILSSPTWSDSEYQSFLETRKLFNLWKID